MKRVKRFFHWFGLILLVATMAGLAGCASTKSDEDKDAVSTLPWNTPAKWEKTAPLGGSMNY